MESRCLCLMDFNVRVPAMDSCYSRIFRMVVFSFCHLGQFVTIKASSASGTLPNFITSRLEKLIATLYQYNIRIMLK